MARLCLSTNRIPFLSQVPLLPMDRALLSWLWRHSCRAPSRSRAIPRCTVHECPSRHSPPLPLSHARHPKTQGSGQTRSRSYRLQSNGMGLSEPSARLRLAPEYPQRAVFLSSTESRAYDPSQLRTKSARTLMEWEGHPSHRTSNELHDALSACLLKWNSPEFPKHTKSHQCFRTYLSHETPLR